MDGALTLRERKKRRTRTAIIEAAYRLFERQGYQQTTIAEIAAAAEISPATFFNYFSTKEDLLFTDDGQRLVEIGVRAIAARGSDETPLATLRRALEQMMLEAEGGFRDPHGELEQIRQRLITSVPELWAASLLRAFAAQQQLTAALCQAYAEDLDDLDAAILVGRTTGALTAASYVAARDGLPLAAALRRAIRAV